MKGIVNLFNWIGEHQVELMESVADKYRGKRVAVMVCVKPSERLPRKNELLAHFSARWCKYQKDNILPNLEVWCVSPGGCFGALGDGWQHVAATGSHEQVLGDGVAAAGLKPTDIIVLVQLTQPLREWWLLESVLRGLANNPCGVVVTAYDAEATDWRALDDHGAWGWQSSERRRLTRIDGALYACAVARLSGIFDNSVAHGVVKHQKWIGEIDVDYRGDLLPRSVLAAMEIAAMRGAIYA